MKNNMLGDTIRLLRKRANMTQEELAEGICSPVSVSRIENGVQMPSGNILEALLEKLGSNTYQLCNIYYKTDQQIKFDEQSENIERLIQTGQIEQAEEQIKLMKNDIPESAECFQSYLMSKATIELKYKKQPQSAIKLLEEALRMTKPSFLLDDFRGILLTVNEANILNLMLVAMYEQEWTRKAIQIGTELVFSLKKHNSTLKEYQVMLLNASMNLAQCMSKENRYEEALEYIEEAENMSINGIEQIFLPEIEYIKATLYFSLGRKKECRDILCSVIPYMELIKKDDIANVARDFAEAELGIHI